MQSKPQHQVFAEQHPLQAGLSRAQLFIVARSGQMKQLQNLFPSPQKHETDFHVPIGTWKSVSCF